MIDLALRAIDAYFAVLDELIEVFIVRHYAYEYTPLLALFYDASDDVVGLVARRGERCDAHGLQDLLDELDLPEEGLRCLIAGSLVLGVLLGAEGASGQVEGDRHVGGSLVVQQRQEHGHEAVDGIGGLAGRRREVVDGQRVKGAKGHRVSVDEKKPLGNRVRGGLRCWTRRRAGRGGAHRASLGP